MLKKLALGLSSLVFPAACAGCAQALEQPAPDPLCAACSRKLPRQQPPLTYRAGVWALSPWTYEGLARDLVLAYKYDARLAWTPFLADQMLQAAGGRSQADLLVPIPLHPVRRRERGFNQAELLAKELSGRLKIPCKSRLLRRAIATEPQSELKRAQRQDNVAGAFELEPDAQLQNKRCLLVDDVVTTGSTAAACAKLLKQAGAASVTLLTLCRD